LSILNLAEKWEQEREEGWDFSWIDKLPINKDLLEKVKRLKEEEQKENECQ
jgi:hypothetical protein